jgi:hypothetical protein
MRFVDPASQIIGLLGNDSGDIVATVSDEFTYIFYIFGRSAIIRLSQSTSAMGAQTAIT